MKPSAHPFLPEVIHRHMQALSDEFPFATLQKCGKSLSSKPIDALTLGCGRKDLLFVGAHHGSEAISAALLMQFADEICRAVYAGETRFGLRVRELLESRRLVILPTVNPDGMEIALKGVCPSEPFGKRLVALNKGSLDFSRWQANARGVDINHNYDHGFAAYKKLEACAGIRPGSTRFSGEYPESEPETLAVARLVESLRPRLGVILSFHTQGEVIYYHDSPLTRQGALFLSRLSGYKAEGASGLAAYGGLTDWANDLGIPAFTLEVGKGKNPLSPSLLPLLYATLREMLFTSLAFF